MRMTYGYALLSFININKYIFIHINKYTLLQQFILPYLALVVLLGSAYAWDPGASCYRQSVEAAGECWNPPWVCVVMVVLSCVPWLFICSPGEQPHPGPEYNQTNSGQVKPGLSDVLNQPSNTHTCTPHLFLYYILLLSVVIKRE